MDEVNQQVDGPLTDDAWLRQQLRNAADRFSDVADFLEAKDRFNEQVPFLRASAERYNRAARARSEQELLLMEIYEAIMPDREGRSTSSGTAITPPPSGQEM